MKRLLLFLCFMLITTGAFAKDFSAKSVKGCYSFNFHGTVITGGEGAPMTAVGRICTDGKGMVTELSRVLHTPGLVVHQTAEGGYTVWTDGTGRAVLTVKTDGVPTSQEEFHFVVTNKQKTLQFISGVVWGPTGEPVDVGVIVSGEAIKQ
jgi:hypothetical protein